MSAKALRNFRANQRSLRSVVSAGLTTLLILAAVAAVAGPVTGDGGVTFTYQAPDAGQVFLAGDFNGWNASDLPLARGEDGLWTVTVDLKPGSHEYKFIVDGAWVEDPSNPQKTVDPYGGFNSVVTVLADGSLAGAGAGAGAGGGAESKAEDAPAGYSVGAPRAVDGGVLFTYEDPSAGSVFLAGSFNGWSASDWPLKNDGKGNWAIVRLLDPGSYEYKFVVDGNWLTDPENPETKSDGYGGMNSSLTLDGDRKVVAAAAAPSESRPTSTLNAKMFLSGRYLTRFELAKNVMSDPRYRLLRPSMSVDLNFDTKVNDLVDAFMRLRMDSNDNVILNNISGNLDEAQLHVHPGKFDVKAYWNREIFTSPDPLHLVGDVDHPATIGHDHLQMGKGTAGALVEADPFGVHFTGLFANVHNFDYYNDPRLFDNTGSDDIYGRFSHEVGPLEVGVPIRLQRQLIWFNFETLVGQPSTGIPAVDIYLDETGDSSTWFETESHDFQSGLDLTLPLDDERTMLLSAQAMYVDLEQGLVTGNQSGQNNVNGAIDVPFFEREETLAGLRWDYRPDGDTTARLQHTYEDMGGSTPDQRTMLLGFQDQSVAENRVYFAVGESPAQTTIQWTEFEGSRKNGDLDLGLYLWKASIEEDFAPVGRTVPGAGGRTSRTIGTWYLSGRVAKGDEKAKFGHGELEFAATLQDPDLADQDYKSFEFIGRYGRNISRSVTAIADVRYIKYDVKTSDPSSGGIVAFDDGFWAPFVGLQYRPIRNLDLVFGYGVDPVEFSIDYQGREFGRWWFRQQYLFDNPDASLLDAEQYLEDARVFTLRAQMTF